ncbi:NUDIX domain-containing protein [Clavibacter phaseoli]|uniref:NUDIX domain-containing protein n=1 Tax=Clavibacter phaseoli TaxID=1734031 RepID=UPI0015FD7727|nr:NUDIX hydrolase [Clavibacter phaseoli]
MEHRVACGLLVRSAHVLSAHRSSTKAWYPHVWDFPGGHLEPGESSLRAPVRELREELDVEIDPPAGGPVRVLEMADARIEIWRIVSWDGVVTNAAPEEHDAIGWFTAREAAALDLADARYPQLIRDALIWAAALPGAPRMLPSHAPSTEGPGPRRDRRS